VGYVVAAVLGYLLGSIPVALLVARRYGVDLRRTGDGNPGAWNALEQLGGRRAAPAFLGDGAKGLAAGLAGHLLAGWWGAFAGVAGAMLGHAFPLFAGFRGGKSVMTLAGGAFALSPPAAAVCLVLCGIVSAIAGFKWGARAGVFAFPAVQLATDPVEHVMATGVLMTLIGLLFVLRSRTSVPATSAPGAAPRG
jgi:acyl phosphate:glycerol-3-phosphate acyltransferase